MGSPHGRWRPTIAPPTRTKYQTHHGTWAGGQAAHRALRGGAIGTSRPTATGPDHGVGGQAAHRGDEPPRDDAARRGRGRPSRAPRFARRRDGDIAPYRHATRAVRTATGRHYGASGEVVRQQGGVRTATGHGRCLRNHMAIGSRGRVTNGKWFSKWLRNGRNWCSCWRNRRLCRLSPSLLGTADYRRYRGRRRLRSADP